MRQGLPDTTPASIAAMLDVLLSTDVCPIFRLKTCRRADAGFESSPKFDGCGNKGVMLSVNSVCLTDARVTSPGRRNPLQVAKLAWSLCIFFS